MRTVKVGVIGCGVIGKRHIQAVIKSPVTELAAIADINEQTLSEVAGMYRIKTIYTKAEELIEDSNVEAVILALPAVGRAQLALYAFQKGKHVLVEKPAGMNAGEIEKMIEAKGNLVAGCCSPRFRFFESADVITGFIADGSLGKIRTIYSRAIKAAPEAPKTPPPLWRQSKGLNGGGILVNWGYYDLDFLFGITGWILKPKWVLADTWRVPPQFSNHVAQGSDAESHYSAFIKCEDNCVITLERGEFVAAKTEESWGIIGTHGSLRLNMPAMKDKSLFFDYSDIQRGVLATTLWKGDDEHIKVHEGPSEDFAKAILENGRTKTTLEHALIIQKIADAIYRSAETGSPAEIL